MADRYVVHRGERRDRAVVLVRNYDGRVFAMTPTEARRIAAQLVMAAATWHREGADRG